MSTEEASQIATSLAELLDPEVVEVLTNYGDPGCFNQAQCELLQVITDFFTGISRKGHSAQRQLTSPAPTGAGDPNSDVESSSSAAGVRDVTNMSNRKRRRSDQNDDGDDREQGKPKKKALGSMGRLLKFTDLDPEYKAFRNTYQHDIPAFFTDPTHEEEPRGEGIKACVENRIVHEYLTYCIEYTDGITSRQTLDAARKAFMWLNCYDTVMHLNKQTRGAGWTGRRVGPRLWDEMDRLLFEGVDVEDKHHTLSQFFMCCKRGLRIKALSEKFGLGCIFYFAECLSEDFVDNKLHETGLQSERVFEALEGIGFKEEVESSGMTEWAEGIRAYCAQALE